MNNIVKKLTSRKFITTVITAITGIITLFIGENEVVNIIAGAMMTIVPTVVYCLVEGVIDSKNVAIITDAVEDAAEQLGANEKTVNTIGYIGEIGEILLDDESDQMGEE